MKIGIAGFVFDISSDLPLESTPVEPEYQDFILSDAPTDINIRAQYVKAPVFPLNKNDKIFESDACWSAYRSDNRPVIAIRTPEQNPYTIAVFEQDFRQGDIYFYPSRLGKEYNGILPSPLAFPLFHLLIISLLSQGHGLLIHAGGIDDNGKGYLFPASSTYGKTTMVRLWQESGEILNDDRIVLRLQDGRFWIYGTPWHGDHPGVSPHGVPLEKIFFIHHSMENKAERKNGVNAAATLLSHSFHPVWDESGMQFTLDFCSKLVDSIPCYDLGFVPDKNTINFIRCVA